MSPLPMLHHHDIMAIVELLHRGRTKLFCHIFNTDKKRRENFHSLALALALTLTVKLRPDHSATKALLMTAVHCAIFNATTLHNLTYCNKRCIYMTCCKEWYVYEE